MPLVKREQKKTPGAIHEKTALNLLRSGSNDERWQAARDLAAFPNAARPLGQALAVEPDPAVREAIYTSLARIDTADSVQAVLPHLRSDDPVLRTGALDTLKAMSTAVRSELKSLLSDADPDVRILACELVRHFPSTQTAALLAAMLETEQFVNVCAAAVDVLAEIGSPDVLPALSRCAARFPDQPFLVFSVRVASERIGVPQRHG